MHDSAGPLQALSSAAVKRSLAQLSPRRQIEWTGDEAAFVTVPSCVREHCTKAVLDSCGNTEWACNRSEALVSVILGDPGCGRQVAYADWQVAGPSLLGTEQGSLSRAPAAVWPHSPMSGQCRLPSALPGSTDSTGGTSYQRCVCRSVSSPNPEWKPGQKQQLPFQGTEMQQLNPAELGAGMYPFIISAICPRPIAFISSLSKEVRDYRPDMHCHALGHPCMPAACTKLSRAKSSSRARS